MTGHERMTMKKAFQQIRHSLKEIKRRIRNSRYIDMREMYRYWEEEHLKRLFKQYQPDCVFDVGANNGQYATMLRQHVGYTGLIVSFEPHPAAAAALRRRSGSDANWLVFEHAISTHDGELQFNIMAASQFSSLSVPDHSQTALFADKNRVAETITVKTETLASALNRLRQVHGFRRPFLKLDTQGWDARIVESSADAMPEFIGLQSELAIKKIYAHSIDFRDALSLYERNGFTLSCFVPNNAGHFPLLVEMDCIMINNRLLPTDHPS